VCKRAKDFKPHVLVIFPDRLRADCISAAGHPVIRTPNIDRLAAEGVRFSNAFTTSHPRGPARHSPAKGLYPHNSNCWMDPDCMEPNADTYMRRLQGRRYRTCLIGKAHFYDQGNVVDRPGEGLQLFDLENDPLEQRNLLGHGNYKDVEMQLRDTMPRRLLKSQFHSTEVDQAFSGYVSVA